MLRSKAYVRLLIGLAAARPSQAPTGANRKPRPGGRQGWGRVDSMHQGGFDKDKGGFHINGIDQVTQ